MRTLKAWTLASAMTLVMQTFPDAAKADLEAGLVGWWPFDDGMSPTEDVINGNDGDLFGDTQFVIPPGSLSDIAPIPGNANALTFDGDGDRAEIADDPTLDITGSFTVSAWIKPSVSSIENNIISKDNAVDGKTNYNLHVIGNHVNLYTTLNATSSLLTVTKGTGGCDPGGCGVHGATNVTIGTWHHVAGVFDNSTKTFRVFLDGTKDGEATFNTTGSPSVNMEHVHIGRREATHFGGPGANATMDDIRLYNRALSDAEITNLANGLVEIAIDIKPDSDDNSINLSSAGVVPVAMLSTAEFSAVVEISPDSIFLGGASVRMIGKGDRFQCHDEDVNVDGFVDLVCNLMTEEFYIQTGDSTAVLEAQTIDGFPVRGEDFVRIVP